jgi:TonB family protein
MLIGLFEDKRDAGEHLFSLAVSLVVHAAVLGLLILYFGSVKIINLNPNITNVLIAPALPPGLQMPNVGPMPANLPPVDADYLDSIPVRRRPPAAPVEIVGSGGRETGPPVDPRFTQGFLLESTPPTRPDIPSADSLRLPIPDRIGEPAGGAGSYTARPGRVDVERYLYSDAYGGLGSGLAGYSGYKPRRSGLRGGAYASAAVKGYDLSPWAESVAAAIQNNWSVPNLLSQTWIKTVEITVVILKNGRLFSAVISEPSDDRSFDRAALEAVEESSPLPALPIDFPEASLEVSFVFSRQ